jgi:metal-responsive CopG/Arc/MetJ family transcriptional regulator
LEGLTMANVARSISLPISLIARLQELAAEREMNLSGYIVSILRQWVQEQDRLRAQHVGSYVE